MASTFSNYKIEDASYTSFIKREIHNLLTQGGFSAHRTGEIDIVVSELASNLVKHAEGGELIYQLCDEGDKRYFEIYGIDYGPGTNDIRRMLVDGASSANTLGHGLGSMNRLSDNFQIYSQSGWGTVVYCRCYAKPQAPRSRQPNNDFSFAALQLPMPGEKLCGDGYCIKKTDDQTIIFLGDGLGHGPHAYDAVQTAIAAFKRCEDTEPSEMLRYISDQVKKTRGLVATIVALNSAQKEWKICGIGNITTRLFEGIVSKNYMAHNGIVGLNIPRTLTTYTVQEERYHTLIMYSDGLKTRFEPVKFNSLMKYDPALIAGVIYKENARRTDDMSVLVGKVNL